MTQQNAAMVEQSANVAQSLNQQTHKLIAAIRYFTLAQGAPTS